MNRDFVLLFKWNDNKKNRLIHNSFIDEKIGDTILYKFDNARIYLREAMNLAFAWGCSIMSTLIRTRAMLPMLGAIGTIVLIIRGLSTSMSTIVHPTPTPTTVPVWLPLKSFHMDNRVLRQIISITVISGSSIDTYSFHSNENRYDSYRERFLHRFSLAKLMAKYYPPRGGLVG